VIEHVPVPAWVARAVGEGTDLGDLPRVPDWPHADTADALRPLAEHPEDTGPGTFLVVHEGLVVGDCGWFGPPDDAGEAEIGYGLAPSARGKGLGTAAVAALLAWVRAQGAVHVRAEVLPGNEASMRLLVRLGFEQVEERAGHLVLRA
jgi:RimJ/RimL family protein N-acetyltransferase